MEKGKVKTKGGTGVRIEGKVIVIVKTTVGTGGTRVVTGTGIVTTTVVTLTVFQINQYCSYHN